MADPSASPEKQKIVDTMALAISTAESHNEHAMKRTGELPSAFFDFRKAADIHVIEGGLVLQKIGEAAYHQGMAALALRDAHNDLERIRAYAAFELPAPTRAGPGGVTPLGNGGGKNGRPQSAPVT